MRILIVEDDPYEAEILQVGLTGLGFAADTASTGEEGESLAESIDYDTIALDVMLPGENGFEVCRALRLKKIDTPIIMISGKMNTDSDIIHGLGCGADEYLLKPVSPEVLAANIRAILRKRLVTRNPRLEIGNLILDTGHRQVWEGKKEIELTAKEYALLEYLAYHPDTVIDRNELEQHVWDLSLDSISNIVDQHIKNLRKKLGAENGQMIQTVRGIGYKLKVQDN